MSHGELWWDFEEHVNVIRACIRFKDFYFLLGSKVADDLTNLDSGMAVEHLLTIFWYNDDVILAVPDHMTLRFKGAHSERGNAP